MHENVKLTSANNSVQIGRKIEGEWVTTKILPTTALPKGTHYLNAAIDPSKQVHPQKFVGPVVHVDSEAVYQLGRDSIAKHRAEMFAQPPKVGQCFEVNYRYGVGSVKGEISQEASEQMSAKKGIRI